MKVIIVTELNEALPIPRWLADAVHEQQGKGVEIRIHTRDSEERLRRCQPVDDVSRDLRHP
jgi:hypothetical protein